MKTELSANSCPKCGAPIPSEAPRGLCPRCVLAGAAAPTEPATAPSHRPSPPALEAVQAAFPQLEIIELIGAGGMGVVFKARQPKLDRLVALKLLPEASAKSPAFAERFNREARVLARLNHPNIVTVFDFGQAGGFFYLLMEFVDGVNLRQAMRAGRFSPAEALKVVPKICDALQFAHTEGILHRDIKPENILLDTRGRVKIADFGIAKLVIDDPRDITLTASGAALGTPHYMAPEQVEHPGDVDHRADIYSLGVVFYEMLTGELPIGRFAAPSAKAELDERIDEIVLRALAKERELRQQSAGQMKTEVEEVTTHPAPPPESPSATTPLVVPPAGPDFILCNPRLPRMAQLLTIYAVIGAPAFFMISTFSWLQSIHENELNSGLIVFEATGKALELITLVFLVFGGFKLRGLRPSAPGLLRGTLWSRVSLLAIGIPVAWMLITKTDGQGLHPIDTFSIFEVTIAYLAVGLEIAALVWLRRHRQRLAQILDAAEAGRVKSSQNSGEFDLLGAIGTLALIAAGGIAFAVVVVLLLVAATMIGIPLGGIAPPEFFLLAVVGMIPSTAIVLWRKQRAKSRLLGSSHGKQPSALSIRSAWLVAASLLAAVFLGFIWLSLRGGGSIESKLLLVFGAPVTALLALAGTILGIMAIRTQLHRRDPTRLGTAVFAALTWPSLLVLVFPLAWFASFSLFKNGPPGEVTIWLSLICGFVLLLMLVTAILAGAWRSLRLEIGPALPHGRTPGLARGTMIFAATLAAPVFVATFAGFVHGSFSHRSVAASGVPESPSDPVSLESPAPAVPSASMKFTVPPMQVAVFTPILWSNGVPVRVTNLGGFVIAPDAETSPSTEGRIVWERGDPPGGFTNAAWRVSVMLAGTDIPAGAELPSVAASQAHPMVVVQPHDRGGLQTVRSLPEGTAVVGGGGASSGGILMPPEFDALTNATPAHLQLNANSTTTLWLVRTNAAGFGVCLEVECAEYPLTRKTRVAPSSGTGTDWRSVLQKDDEEEITQ